VCWWLVAVLWRAGDNGQEELGPLTATIVPSTHHPKINAKWPLSVTATLAAKPAHATSLYLFMLGPMS